MIDHVLSQECMIRMTVMSLANDTVKLLANQVTKYYL